VGEAEGRGEEVASKVMPRFSERAGAVPPRELQLRSMDAALRVAIWNWLDWALNKDTTGRNVWRDEYWHKLAKAGLWDEVLHLPVDEVQLYNVQSFFKERFFRFEWHDVYEAVEWMLPRINSARGQFDRRPDLEAQLNSVLEREMSGYRALRRHLVEVTSSVEIAEIQEAATEKVGFEGVRNTFKPR
jgi:AbiJ-like protein